MTSQPERRNGHALGTTRRKDGLLTTGDMARLSDSTLRTVRFYEEAGILHPVQRTEGGHRLFPPAELDKLRLVTDLRAAGFALEEIREMLEAKHRAENGAVAAADVLTRLDHQITSMTERLELLKRLVEELEHTRDVIARCTGCSNKVNFPNRCDECQTMSDVEEAPNAVSVLWGVHR